MHGSLPSRQSYVASTPNANTSSPARKDDIASSSPMSRIRQDFTLTSNASLARIDTENGNSPSQTSRHRSPYASTPSTPRPVRRELAPPVFPDGLEQGSKFNPASYLIVIDSYLEQRFGASDAFRLGDNPNLPSLAERQTEELMEQLITNKPLDDTSIQARLDIFDLAYGDEMDCDLVPEYAPLEPVRDVTWLMGQQIQWAFEQNQVDESHCLALFSQQNEGASAVDAQARFIHSREHLRQAQKAARIRTTINQRFPIMITGKIPNTSRGLLDPSRLTLSKIERGKSLDLSLQTYSQSVHGGSLPYQFNNVVEEMTCTFCVYDCDYGISNEYFWLPVEASGGYCVDCYTATSTIDESFDELNHYGHHDPERDFPSQAYPYIWEFDEDMVYMGHSSVKDHVVDVDDWADEAAAKREKGEERHSKRERQYRLRMMAATSPLKQIGDEMCIREHACALIAERQGRMGIVPSSDGRQVIPRLVSHAGQSITTGSQQSDYGNASFDGCQHPNYSSATATPALSRAASPEFPNIVSSSKQVFIPRTPEIHQYGPKRLPSTPPIFKTQRAPNPKIGPGDPEIILTKYAPFTLDIHELSSTKEKKEAVVETNAAIKWEDFLRDDISTCMVEDQAVTPMEIEMTPTDTAVTSAAPVISLTASHQSNTTSADYFPGSLVLPRSGLTISATANRPFPNRSPSLAPISPSASRVSIPRSADPVPPRTPIPTSSNSSPYLLPSATPRYHSSPFQAHDKIRSSSSNPNSTTTQPTPTQHHSAPLEQPTSPPPHHHPLDPTYQDTLFCRGCSWRHLDIHKLHICPPCLAQKTTIITHMHTSFSPLSHPPNTFSPTPPPNPRVKRCMICPAPASYACDGCELRVCERCEVCLVMEHQGDLDGFFWGLVKRRAHLRNDAFLLRGDARWF